METLSESQISIIAKLLDRAAQHQTAIAQISLNQSFTEAEAYEIQRLAIEERLNRGQKLVGLKLGFTSYAKMEQMGVHDMIWGRLTDDMIFENGGDLDFSQFIHPRAEPEICFRISKDINQEISLEEAPDFVDGIAAAIEIIDSRYENFKFSLADVIADNCSSSGVVLGKWHDVSTQISDLKIDLLVNGEVSETGNSNDILGNPWLSVVNAARLGVKYNQPLKKGHILMAGAATSAVFIQIADRVEAKVEGFDTVGFEVA